MVPQTLSWLFPHPSWTTQLSGKPTDRSLSGRSPQSDGVAGWTVWWDHSCLWSAGAVPKTPENLKRYPPPQWRVAAAGAGHPRTPFSTPLRSTPQNAPRI